MDSFGRKFRVSIFGESHGEAIGVVLDGVQPGLQLSVDDFTADILRRKSGAKGTTPRGFSSGFSSKKTVLIELFDNKGNKIDQFQRGEKGEGWGGSLPNNKGSWSRVPDGTGKWMITATFTPGEKNSTDGTEDPDVIQ